MWFFSHKNKLIYRPEFYFTITVKIFFEISFVVIFYFQTTPSYTILICYSLHFFCISLKKPSRSILFKEMIKKTECFFSNFGNITIAINKSCRNYRRTHQLILITIDKIIINYILPNRCNEDDSELNMKKM